MVKKLRRVNHRGLDVRAVSKLSDQSENVLDPTGLYPICWALTAEEAVRSEEPQTRLIGGVELAQLINQPLEREKPLQPISSGLHSPRLPPRDGLRRRIEKLCDVARFDASPRTNGFETCCNCASHLSPPPVHAPSRRRIRRPSGTTENVEGPPRRDIAPSVSRQASSRWRLVVNAGSTRAARSARSLAGRRKLSK